MAGSDTRPPMLDRTNFKSWQQRIRLYCMGKDNGENIMKSITEGPFQMGTMRDTLTEGGEGALHLGPERARVFADLSAEQKDRNTSDIHLTNILLQEHKSGTSDYKKRTTWIRDMKVPSLESEIEKVKQHYKEIFESIKITCTSTKENTSSLLTQIEDLKAQLEGNLKVSTRSSVKTKVLAPGMYAIDVEPIPPRLKNNKSAHLTYINHLKESVEIVREIVEEARVTKQIWKPKGKLSDNSLKKTKQVWKATGKLFANVGYQWRPTGKKFTLGKLNCGYNGDPQERNLP
ncbi:hypothetical protein Tco_1437563 [Tanacetum coccineum]